jgi:hypothetical protein
MERMTNPCFQNTEFAKVMKGKHLTNTWEDTMLESVADISGSDNGSVNDELNPGSDNGSVNDEFSQINPLANSLSEAIQVPGRRKSARLQGGTQVQVTVNLSAQRRLQGDSRMAIFTTENQNPQPGKHSRKRRPTPANEDLRYGKRLRTTTA